MKRFPLVSMSSKEPPTAAFPATCWLFCITFCIFASLYLGITSLWML